MSNNVTVVDQNQWKRGDPIKYIREEIASFALPTYSGERYETCAPDTLDLQERAEWAINGLTGPTDEQADYEIYWRVHFRSNPPAMHHTMDDHVQAKFWEALPLMRLMSGSTQNMHIEEKWLEVMLRMQGPDGLLYWPLHNRPWGLPEKPNPFAGLNQLPQSDHLGTFTLEGRGLGAMSLYALLDPAGPWSEAAHNLAEGINRIAVSDGDMAYLPSGSFEPGQKANANNCTPPKFYQAATAAWVIQGLVQCYRAIEYQPALTLAGNMVRYLQQEGEYVDNSGAFMPDFPQESDVGEFVDLTDVYAMVSESVHFHTHSNVLLASLEYIQASGDRRLLEWVKRGYDYGVRRGQPLLGWFPEWLSGKPYPQTSETCQVADMIACAVKLSLLGDDRWDDVDRWVRNQLVENQLTHYDWIYHGAQNLPISKPRFNESMEKVPERNLGAFAGWPTPNDWIYYPEHPHAWTRGIMHCCTGNGSRALYYVWENILQFEKGCLHVNLLLNRASAWADIHSHLPYTGQVDIHLKTSLRLKVRIPGWVPEKSVVITVNNESRHVTWQGRYVDIGNMQAGDQISFVFPFEERTETLCVEKQKYRFVFKGHDVVSVDPPGVNAPLYQRERYRREETRWRNITRFIADSTIHW